MILPEYAKGFGTMPAELIAPDFANKFIICLIRTFYVTI
jgi:hypothetical protein